MRALAAPAAIALLASSTRAGAVEPARPVVEALRVEPNGCFDAASLAPQVARWLKRDAVDRRIELEIRGDPRASGGAELTVRRDGRVVAGRAFPRFDAPCAEVGAAVSLGAALAIDATLLDALGVQVPPPPPPRPLPPPPRPVVTVFGALEGVALIGVVGGPAPGFAPALELSFTPAFALRLSGLFTGSGAVAVGAGRADASLFAGRVDACAAFSVPAVVFRACAGLGAGTLQAIGVRDVGAPASAAAPWVAALARVEVRRPFTAWLHLGISADVVLPFVRPTFEIVDAAGSPLASVRAPPLGGALGAGPTFLFQ
jgi:hypothetical protein